MSSETRRDIDISHTVAESDSPQPFQLTVCAVKQANKSFIHIFAVSCCFYKFLTVLTLVACWGPAILSTILFKNIILVSSDRLDIVYIT